MELRRILVDGAVQTQEREPGGAWRPRPEGPVVPTPTDTDAERARRALLGLDDDADLLPFVPASFRDFMLYEQHAIDAARGLVRRFHPGQYRAARGVEVLTRRAFPAFRPRPLFDRQPVYYLGNHLTFVPSGTPVTAPGYTTALDYELELGFVLSRPLRDATPDEALAAIGAFVLVNDLSARDVQRAEMASGFGPQKAKHFASSMASVAVTPDAVLPRLDDLRGAVVVNGREVSTVSSAGARWSVGEALAHCSRGEQLFPGELFATGTLPGGSGMETGHWVGPGDTLVLSLDGVGTIEHTIAPS